MRNTFFRWTYYLTGTCEGLVATVVDLSRPNAKCGYHVKENSVSDYYSWDIFGDSSNKKKRIVA